MHSLTPAELNQSIWALDGTVFLLYGFSPALGGFVAGMGALLYTRAKGSTVLKFGIGVFLAFVIAMVLTQLRYLHWFFSLFLCI